MDRIQTIGRGNVVFKERCCRVSYGVRCRQEYQPDKYKSHVGQKVVEDPLDRKRYVENQIDWFVKQVSKASLRRSNHCKANPDQLPGRKRSQQWFLETISIKSEARSRGQPLENEHRHVD